MKKILFLLGMLVSISSFANETIPFTLPLTLNLPKVITTPLMFDTPEITVNWNELLSTLQKVDNTVINVNLEGFGGSTWTGNDIIRAIEESKTRHDSIIVTIVGGTYSMSAIFACFADKAIMLPGTTILFHQSASYETFLGREYRVITHSYDMSPESFQQEYFFDKCEANGFINKEDRKLMDEDYDTIITNVRGTLLKYHQLDPGDWKNVFHDLAVYSLLGLAGALAVGLYLNRVIRKLSRALKDYYDDRNS